MDHKKKRMGFRKKSHKPSFNQKNYTNRNVQKQFRHQDQMTEPEVGISEFISNLEGFKGVLKARYSDFHVCEVDLDGKTAVLTDTNIPKEEEVLIDYDLVEESPVDIIPQDMWNNIKDMVKNGSQESIKLDISGLNKDERKNVHIKIKEIFGNKIDTNTIDEDGKKLIVFRKPIHGCRERYVWPAGRGQYVHFILYKEALDTMTACYKVADLIRIKPSHISYAGIKDKRAKTTQWMCIKQVEPWKLIKKSRPLTNIKMGNITFKDYPLKLGDLRGNRFKICLRNVVADNKVIDAAVEHAKKHGFINYYGLQRFGNDKEVPTFSIGVQLLLGNWKEACDLILKPKKSDDPLSDIAQAKKVYTDTDDVDKACKCLNRSKNDCVEAKLLQGLLKEKKNYVNALESIPRNMRLLYIHSFQSLVWNKMVSERIKKYGLKPAVNDLVVINDLFIEPEIVPTEVQADSDAIEVQESEPEVQKVRQHVKALTESDLSNYTINDIVLPLPGYDVEYPQNLKEEYKEELTKHGLTLEMPKQSVKTYTLSGAYRKILGRIEDLHCKIMRYNDPNKSLILSDFDVLRNFEEPVDIPDGKFKAVILEFTLSSANYATMVLREIMKIDTSPSAQAKMNEYAAKPNGTPSIEIIQEVTSKQPENVNSGLMPNSILNDKEKMEELKRSIFGDTSVKRKIQTDEEVSPKKQKTDKTE